MSKKYVELTPDDKGLVIGPHRLYPTEDGTLMFIENGVPSGVAHFVRNTTPTVRVDGSALVVGDRWYNPSTGYQWFWNGTYWLGDPAISANTDVAANTAARHAAVTVTDSSEIDFTLTGQNITASLINGSIGETRLSSGVNTSLGLANTALQPSTIGVTVQGYDADLAAIAALSTTANGRALLTVSQAITINNSAPGSPAAGDLWYNPSTGIWGFWNGTYWLTAQTFGPRGSFTFVSSPESFVTTNDGVGLTYGAFIEKLIIRYKTRTTAHDVSNYRNLNLTFRGARNAVDELNITRVIPLNNTITNGVLYPYPTTTYVTVEEVINTYAGARGDVNINTATSTTIAGSPSELNCSFWLVMRGILA